jgi:hypothetical protein
LNVWSGDLFTCRLNGGSNHVGRGCSSGDYDWSCSCRSNHHMLRRGTCCWCGIRECNAQNSALCSCLNRCNDRGLLGCLHSLLLLCSRGDSGTVGSSRGGSSCSIRV